MISLLLVNYRSAALAAEAVRTARAATANPLQVVIVDNSNEADQLRAFADTVIVSGSNRGYAGGINHGRPACNGDTIVVANPDVRFAPQSLDLLADALRNGVAVAGPALFWDDEHRWLLPPGDVYTTLGKLDQVLASRSPRWREQRDRRRFLNRLRFWTLTRTTDVETLSGAVLAIRARDFDDAGGFDERFPLYFEETDFLRRLREARRRIVHVPAARVRHMYNQSAGQVASEAGAKYAQSERRYLEKWSGPFMARLLKRLEKPPATPVIDSTVRDGQIAITEASPDPYFSTAAGYFGKAGIPDGIRRTLKSDFYLRHLTKSGEILATYKISA